MPLNQLQRPLIFGGSFDPPHLAHLELPEAVRRVLDADAILYIPAARAPHKLSQQQTAAHHRQAMLELALADRPDAHVLTVELDRFEQTGRPSYTVDTLEALLPQLAPHAKPRLLIGTDQALVFDTWRAADRIQQLAEPVVMLRPPTQLTDLPEPWQPRAVRVPESSLSSTAIRQRLANGEPVDDMLPPAVAAYITEHRLYQP